VKTYADARRFFGFGELVVDPAGTLTATLRGVEGQPLYELKLTPSTTTRLARLP
jgi:hypothetical protein